MNMRENGEFGEGVTVNQRLDVPNQIIPEAPMRHALPPGEDTMVAHAQRFEGETVMTIPTAASERVSDEPIEISGDDGRTLLKKLADTFRSADRDVILAHESVQALCRAIDDTLRSPIQGEVKALAIKPLEWDGDKANTIVGEYSVELIAQGGVYGMILPGWQDATFPHSVEGSEAECKAAAQADFNARIVSCLSPPAPEPIAEPVEGNTVCAWPNCTCSVHSRCAGALASPPAPKPEAVSDELTPAQKIGLLYKFGGTSEWSKGYNAALDAARAVLSTVEAE